MSEQVEQLKTEIMDLAKEADASGVGTELYRNHNNTMQDKIMELKSIDREAAQAVRAELMEMRTGMKS